MTEDDTFDALKYPPTGDDLEFGRNVWIYCGQHLRHHLTGWCSVSNRYKVKLRATTEAEAIAECKVRGFFSN